MRPYGTIHFENNLWVIDAEPHLLIALKANFQRIEKTQKGTVTITHTGEVARKLQWFMTYYPLEIPAASKKRMTLAARGHEEKLLRLETILDASYKPRPIPLALPARDYQKVAAEVFLAHEKLLIADDVGLGKTIEALAAFAAQPKTLPAAVVTLAGVMGRQWESQIRQFMPQATAHVLEKRDPYELPKFMGRGPDIVILTYAKLDGWAKTLGRYVKTVVYDECQELRRPESNKYVAAQHLAGASSFRLGLSVGPDSMILVRREQVVRYVRIDDFSEEVGVIDDIFVPVEGYEVRSFDGNRFCWKPVKAALKHRATGKRIFRIFTEKGRSLAITEDHSIIKVTPNGGSVRGKPTAVLEQARGSELKVGDHVLLEDKIESEIATLEWIEFVSDDELRRRGGQIHTRGKGHIWTQSRIPVRDCAYILGFYIGDGWVTDSRIAFAVEKPRVRKFLKKLSCLLRWTKVNVSIRDMRGESVEVRFSNAVLASFMRAFFRNASAWEKQIPEEAYSFSKEDVRSFIQGMLDSDGSLQIKRGGKAWYYTTTSRDLAYGLVELLKKVNVVAGISKSDCIGQGGVVNGRKISSKRPKYQVFFTHSEWIGENYGRKGRRVRFTLDGMNGHPARIKDVREELTDYVYDLSVEGDDWNTFVASGILVHNSATPIYNYGGEIFNVVEVLAPGALGTRAEFLREWCTGYGRSHKLVNPPAFGSYMREQFLILRRTRSEVGRELPPLTKIPHPIDTDREPLGEIEDSARALAELILSDDPLGRGDRMRAAEELDWKLRHATGVAKAPHVADFIRILVENGESVVVFAWHLSVYDILKKRLFDLEPAMFTGQETEKQKQESFRRFTEKETPVLLMSLRAGAGVDGLQKACRTVVFAELDWSAGVLEQNIGRVFRDGQKDPVTAYYLVADEGSDPVVSEKLGIKAEQIAGIRDPNRPLVEENPGDPGRAESLARHYLRKLDRKRMKDPI